MNAYKLAFALALAAASTLATAAPADRAPYRFTVNASSRHDDSAVQKADANMGAARTRADVKAEARDALRRGEVSHGEPYLLALDAASVKSRAEVKQELREAQLRGEISHGEPYPMPMAVASSKSRAEVIAELKEYRLTHPADVGEGVAAP